MSILINVPDRNTALLKQRLEEYLPGVEVYNDLEEAPPAEITMAILWKQKKGSLEAFPNLKALHSLGAGVDHIFSDESIPNKLPLARIVDEQLATGMRRYVLMAILNFHKNLYYHLDQQKRKSWSDINTAEVEMRVGVMGMGALGAAIAKDIKALGFEVYGFSNRAKAIAGIPCFSQKKGELSPFLSKVNTLVCVLPLTPATKDFLNIKLFRELPEASYLINVGRGQQLVDEDLLQAIEEGKIKGACLDVLRVEPLPEAHPFWTHPKIILTPHIASISNQETVALQIAENYRRVLKGEVMLNQVSWERGY